MAGFCLLYRIHGERAQRVGHMAQFRVPRREEWRCGGGGGGGSAHSGRIASPAVRASTMELLGCRRPQQTVALTIEVCFIYSKSAANAHA